MQGPSLGDVRTRRERDATVGAEDGEASIMIQHRRESKAYCLSQLLLTFRVGLSWLGRSSHSDLGVVLESITDMAGHYIKKKKRKNTFKNQNSATIMEVSNDRSPGSSGVCSKLLRQHSEYCVSYCACFPDWPMTACSNCPRKRTRKVSWSGNCCYTKRKDKRNYSVDKDD